MRVKTMDNFTPTMTAAYLEYADETPGPTIISSPRERNRPTRQF